jgi:uncharacterized protein (DUF58 family)
MPFKEAWLLIGALLVLIGFAVREPVLGGVGVVIVVVGGMARLWSRHLFDRLGIDVALGEDHAFAGEAVPVSLTVDNPKLLPMPWLEWRLAVPDGAEAVGERLAASAAPGSSWLVRRAALGWYERRRWDTALTFPARGYYTIGPSSVRSADLFGIFPRHAEFETPGAVVVYPQVRLLEELGLPADRPFGEQPGGSPLFDDPLRVSGLREYRPGDPLRRVDWKATARSGTMTSRLYEPSATRQLYIALNIDTLAHSWEGYLRDELELTISVAASVAHWASEARFAVGLLANGSYPRSDRPMRLPPSRAPGQLQRVLEALAVIQPLTMSNLAGTLQRERHQLPAGSTIVCVASLVPEELGGVLDRLRDEGHRVALLATSDRAPAGAPPGIPVHRVGRPFAPLGAAR